MTWTFDKLGDLDFGKLVYSNYWETYVLKNLTNALEAESISGLLFRYTEADSWIMLKERYGVQFWTKKAIIHDAFLRFNYLGTIHLRRRQILHDFWPLPTPLPSAVFYYYPSENLANFDPPPKKMPTS